MSNSNADWASRLGTTVRFLVATFRLFLFIGALVLVVRGLWLFDAGLGYIGAGMFILFFFAPRPGRGK